MEAKLFWFAMCANGAILLGMLTSLVGSSKIQFWPPPNRYTWQYRVLWWSVRIIVLCIILLGYLEWALIEISHTLRFWAALPIFLVTFLLGSAAAFNLGWENTHGIAKEFVTHGFYRFSRNPQYVMYSISFVALSILIASPKALVLLWVLALWYLIAPFSEERWLQDKYGEQYLNYKKRVPRYF